MKVGLPGIAPFSMDMTAFISLDKPAAGSECPILLLMEPIMSGLSAERVAEKTAAAPLTSLASPACVPVPWHSRNVV